MQFSEDFCQWYTFYLFVNWNAKSKQKSISLDLVTGLMRCQELLEIDILLPLFGLPSIAISSDSNEWYQAKMSVHLYQYSK